MRVTTATRARSGAPSAAASGGSFPARMAMKMTLSMPSTISSAVSVASEIRPAALGRSPLATAAPWPAAGSAAAISGQATSMRNDMITTGKRVHRAGTSAGACYQRAGSISGL